MKTLESKMRPGGMLPILVLTLSLASLSQAAEGVWLTKADMPTGKDVAGHLCG